MNLRFPNLNAPTLDAQMQQLKSYLFQVVEQINIETNSTEPITKEDVEEIINNAISPLEQRIKRLEVKLNEGE